MKKYFNLQYITFMLVIFILATLVSAQITIQSSEYNIAYGTEHNLYSAEDSVGDGFDVNVGTIGGSQTWTFTLEQFPDGYFEKFTVVDPETTPFHEYLPNSNNVWHNFYEDDTTSLYQYQYFTLTSDALFFDAMIISDGDSSIIMAPEPSEQVIKFPAQMGASWTNNYVEEFEIGDFGVKDSTSSVSTIDAWGAITIPAGTFDCLRVREDKTSYASLILFGIPMGVDTSTSISYMWIGKQYGMLASITSQQDETNPDFTKASNVSIRYSVATDIVGNNNHIQNFELFQNYPNPFNPVTTISYQLTKASHVELIIYNSLGEKMETLVNEYQSPGLKNLKWNAGTNPSGVYFYELITTEGGMKRKMILLK
ncbi:MAG: T9SS type A sorting domain-containing protein [Calditrichaceae bacterium]|nr:T9SS type A sorting domain-containing protein [Calditrichaceae bacterium]